MDGFRLTAEEIRSLRALHRGCKDRQWADRIKAVVLLGTGWTVTDTAEALLLDEDTIRSYRQAYQQGGADLLLMVRYQGRDAKLNPDQIRELDQHLSVTTYLRAQDVAAYVKRTFRVVYTVAGMTDFLKRLDYVYKKPTLTPGQHPDVEIQQAFIESYQKLKENKGKNDPIYFMDGVHPRHNPVAAYGWIKRGTDKTMESNTGRSRVNINGAVDVARLRVVVEFGDAVNAQSTIALLRRLEARHRKAKTIYVDCDNARYYRSRLVQAYLSGSKIKLIFLPAYCPNLNLIERRWKYFRKQVLYNRYYEHFAEFKAACQGFFESIDEQVTALRSLLTENFQVITA
jgi:transposase